MPNTVVAARMRDFKVLWYAAPASMVVSIINPGRPPVHKRAKPQRVAAFTVRARTLDGARRKVAEYVRKRGRHPLTINFQDNTKLVVYTKDAP